MWSFLLGEMMTLTLRIGNNIIKFMMEKSSRYTEGARQRWVHAKLRPHREMAGVIWNDRISLPKGFQGKIVGSVYFYLFNSDVTFLVRRDSKLSLLMSFLGKSARACGITMTDVFFGTKWRFKPSITKDKASLSLMRHLPPQNIHSSGFLLKSHAILLGKTSLDKPLAQVDPSRDFILTETYIRVRWLPLPTGQELTISPSPYSRIGQVSFEVQYSNLVSQLYWLLPNWNGLLSFPNTGTILHFTLGALSLYCEPLFKIAPQQHVERF